MRCSISAGLWRAVDAGSKLGHLLLDRGEERRVARAERRFDRLEAVEIGRQRQRLRLCLVARAIGGEALLEPVARQPQARLLGGDGIGMGAQERNQRPGLVGADLRGELVFGQGAQGVEIGNPRPDCGIMIPDRLAFLRQRIGISEAADAEGERPFVGIGQLGEALHRRALEALADHLVQSERAALPRALAVDEGDRRRVELARHRRVRIALGAMAGRAIFLEQLRAARQVWRLPRPEWNGIGGEQVLAEGVRRSGDVLLAGLMLDQRRELLAFGDQRRLSRGLPGGRRSWRRPKRKIPAFRHIPTR